MWLLYIVGFFVIVSLYLTYVSVSVPASAVIVFAIYLIGMPVAYVAGLGTVLATRPSGLPAPRRWPKPPADGDPAVLQYFYGPAMADADHAVRVAQRNCGKLWDRGVKALGEAFTDDDVTWFTAPLGVGGAIGMALGAVVGMVITAVFNRSTRGFLPSRRRQMVACQQVSVL